MNFFINEAMGIGNSGVEHAQFYRAKRFDQAQLPYRFVFMGLINNLHEAMDKWDLRDDQVINIWEFLVFGDDYGRHGLTARVADHREMVVDSTNTNRFETRVTSSNMRIVRHFVKYPNPKKENHLLVSVDRVELYDNATNQRKVMFEEVPNPHGDGEFEIRNIHLYDQPEGQLFFPNPVQLRRYFLHRLEKLYPGQNVFILDRGEPNEVALMDDEFRDNRKLVAIVHADHLSDRDDPKNPLWNNYYEYTLSHMDRVDRLVVATKLQREDLLIDFPNGQKQIVTIPVGGVSDVPPTFQPQPASKELRLITLSRLAGEKHIDLIVKAVIKLHDQGLPVMLDIYGAGEEKSKLATLIKDNHAETYVELKGLTHHADQVYPQYDAFVSASYSEGFGLTYIEALNAGLPVVTFNARFGAMEMIHDGVNGYAYDFKRDDEDFNIEQLEAGIKRLTTTDLTEMRTAVLASVAEFRDQVIADKWRTLIDEL
jgi:poly(glycerol-phosphate) alpha-glucosyltransferase